MAENAYGRHQAKSKSQILCAEVLGQIGPALYGTLVHLAFAADVRWQDIPGIGSDGVEQSFSFGDVVQYGTNGSIRTDVVLRDDNDEIIAVWDVKTGNAELTDARKQEIRDELNLSPNVPIMMLHISRGIAKTQRRTGLEWTANNCGLYII